MWSTGQAKYIVTVSSLRRDKRCRLLMRERGTGGKRRLRCMSKSWKDNRWPKKSARLQQQRCALCCLCYASSMVASGCKALQSISCPALGAVQRQERVCLP